MRVKDRQPVRTLRVVADDRQLVTHSGLVVVDKLVERLGLERELTEAIGVDWRRHPPGRTLVRLASMLLAGGDCVSHLSALRDQPALFSTPTAHATTAWRLLAERLVGREPGAVAPQLGGIAEARALVRERAWRAGMRPRSLVIDIDAHLVTAHSEDKEAASSTFKRTYGFCPMLAYLADTNEALSGILRPGCGLPNDVADELELVDLALAQLPAETDHSQVVIRSDAAGYAKDFAAALNDRGLGFVIGARLFGGVRDAVLAVPEQAWQPIVGDDEQPRPDAWLCEVAWPEPRGWPDNLRLIARREVPHAGAQLSFCDEQGHRFVACITNLAGRTPADIEQLHRQHAVVEDRIREARQLGLGNLPFSTFRANHAWLQVVLLAQDLAAWTHALTRPAGAQWMEPKTLRFCLLAVAGRITRHARQPSLHLPAAWPWSTTIIDAYQRALTVGAATPK